MSRMHWLTWIGASAALVACGGAQLNQARVAEVQSQVSSAEAVGANDEPKAALHLQLAKDEMAEARRLAADGKGDEAALVLERARADAELAMQLARTEHEQEQARAAWQKTQELDAQQGGHSQQGGQP